MYDDEVDDVSQTKGQEGNANLPTNFNLMMQESDVRSNTSLVCFYDKVLVPFVPTQQ
jgi:hypothetical protein